MSVSKRLLVKRNSAELASVERMLSSIDPDDHFGRLSMESRRRDLQLLIDDASKSTDSTAASAAIYFGGAPVLGSIGIESGFGGAAVSKFQDLVAKLLIDEREGLGLRGPLPAHDDAKLHITQTLRGSFGFLLEEVGGDGALWETPLKSAVERATRLLESFSDQNEEAFEQVLEGTDPRSLATASDLFSLLDTNKATMRLVTDEQEMQVDSAAVERATQRALTSKVHEYEDQLVGILNGLLPQSHMFELLVSHGSDLVSGRVVRSLSAEELSVMLSSMLGKLVTAVVNVREVIRDGQVTRKSYVLTSLVELPEEPNRVYVSQF